MGEYKVKCSKCGELFAPSSEFSECPVCPDCLLKTTQTLDAPENVSKLKAGKNSGKIRTKLKPTKKKYKSEIGQTGRRQVSARMERIQRRMHSAVFEEGDKKAKERDFGPLKKTGRHKTTVRMERIRRRRREADKKARPASPLNRTTHLDSSKFGAIASTGRYRIKQIKNKQDLGSKFTTLAAGVMTLTAALMLDLVLLVFFYFPPTKEKPSVAACTQKLTRKTTLPSLEKIYQLPDKQIDLATTALLVAKEDYELTYKRKLDIKKYLAIVDEMAMTIQGRINDNMEPERVIAEICRYLYDEQKFLTSQNGWDPGNLYLNFILDGKQGYCLGFAELWLALAERIQWRGKPLPIYGVLAPFHIFCRWEDKSYRRNIETLHVPPIDKKTVMVALVSDWLLGKSSVPKKAGRNIPDSFYREQYNITSESMKNGVYLQNVSKKVVIGCIYSNRSCLQMDRLESLKTREERKKMLERAGNDVEQASKWSPKNVPGMQAQAGIYIQYRGEYQKAVNLLAKLEKIDPTAKTFILLGMAHTYLGNYEKALQYLARAEKAKVFRRKTLSLIPYLKANVYYSWGKFSDAEEFCIDFLKKNYDMRKPEEIMARVLILKIVVKICNSRGNCHKAKLYAWRLQNILGEKTEEVGNAWGDIFRHEKKWEKARCHYQEVLRLYNSCSPESLYGMGVYWKHEKEYRRAVDCFQQTLMYEINFIEAREQLLETRRLLRISEKLKHFSKTYSQWALAASHL